MTSRRIVLQSAVLAALAVVGLASAIYVLANQSSGLPFFATDTYRIRAEITLANGVRPSVGQPVSVAGVRVGQIADVGTTAQGNAVLELDLDRGQLPAVYGDARATLEPITPLKDLILNLDPGAPPADQLAEGATIDVANSVPPAELSTLLAELDADTRAFLTTLISSLDEGTRGQADGLRRALAALGPTTAQLHRLTRALDGRRAELARTIHNLARVTRAASRDERLSVVVTAGNATLRAVAGQNPALRTALSSLPGSLAATDEALEQAATLAGELGPTVAALQPAMQRLPDTLDAVRDFADTTTPMLADDLRPLVREGRPLVRDLGAALPLLNRIAPNGTDTLQVVTYFLNEMAFNPPGDDEGGLFWFSWFMHNWLTFVGSIGDAHGLMGRSVPFVNCDPAVVAAQEIQALVHVAFGLEALCP